MRKDSRLMMALAALLLVPAYWLPLWSIQIVAPQYNDGLGMYIGLDDIWGHKQHDIQNINILNHYIGMQAIVPAEVDVLTIMPWVVGFLIVSALLVALIGKRWLIGGWLGAFAVLGSAGLYELYRWKYDYGHNLDPMAPIKIPDMTYMPPLIGTKQLLNMTTTSLPTWGTLFIALAFIVGALALINERWPLFGAKKEEAANETASDTAERGSRTAASAKLGLSATAGTIALLIMAGCGNAEAGAAQQDTDARLGSGPDAYCGGEIAGVRFGGQLTTTDGAVYEFGSIECLAGFLIEQRVPSERVASVKVVDYNHGTRLLDAATAKYVAMQFDKSPNGLNLAAVETDKVAGTLHYFHGGERMDWKQVLAYVQQEWELE